jgi:hypothetical protein
MRLMICLGEREKPNRTIRISGPGGPAAALANFVHCEIEDVKNVASNSDRFVFSQASKCSPFCLSARNSQDIFGLGQADLIRPSSTFSALE